MHEVGIDLSAATPQKLILELAQEAQVLVTMGCGDKCPHAPGARIEDRPPQDPKGQPIERACRWREQIRQRVTDLIAAGARRAQLAVRQNKPGSTLRLTPVRPRSDPGLTPV